MVSPLAIVTGGGKDKNGKHLNGTLRTKQSFDAIRLQSECLYVIRHGCVVCRTVPARRTLEFEGKQENIDFRLTAENL